LIREESTGSIQLFLPGRIRKAQEFQVLQDQEKEKEKDTIIVYKVTAIQKKKDIEQEKEDKYI
jgi:hypothetical protein